MLNLPRRLEPAVTVSPAERYPPQVPRQLWPRKLWSTNRVADADTFRRTGIGNFGTTVHNDVMAQDHGWFSYTGSGDNSHLTDEQRQIVEERIRSRGQLQGVVQVKVYENGCEPFITFPDGASLGVETDQSVIADMVARARTQLVDWQ
jgi:hypothetical protein